MAKKKRAVLTRGNATVVQRRFAGKDPFVPTKILTLADIKPRTSINTRALDAKHLVTLAESIAALGLLEPIVIDRDNYLLAGGHRLGACQLLSSDPEARGALLLKLCSDIEQIDPELIRKAQELPSVYELNPKQIPVRVIDFSSAEDVDRALAIEATENEHRRDYTRQEVKALYHRLISQGFTDQMGRPKPGDRPVKPAIALLINKSVRTIHRLLKPKNDNENTTRVALSAGNVRRKCESAVVRSLNNYLECKGVSKAKRESAEALLATLMP